MGDENLYTIKYYSPSSEIAQVLTIDGNKKFRDLFPGDFDWDNNSLYLTAPISVNQDDTVEVLAKGCGDPVELEGPSKKILTLMNKSLPFSSQDSDSDHYRAALKSKSKRKKSKLKKRRKSKKRKSKSKRR